MNLLQIRTDFVQKNGRIDLVVDETDYADNGANFFIQAGQRLLDSILPHRKSMGRYHTAVNVNQSSVIIEKVRYIDSVYQKQSGSDRDYLDRKSYSWLIEEYGEDFGEKAKGTATFSGNVAEDETIVVDTETYTFKASPSGTYEVDIGSNVDTTITNLVAKINTASSIANAYKMSSTACLIEYYLVGTAGNSIVFTTTAANVLLDGSGTLGTTLAGRANGVTSGTPAYFAPIITTPHPDLTIANVGSLDTHDLMFDLGRYAKDGILFMPPANGSYELTIYGAFFSVMSADADVSYHSEMYPELLIMASNFALEVFYRNTQGMADWLSAMQPFLKGIDHDMVRAESVLAGNQLRG